MEKEVKTQNFFFKAPTFKMLSNYNKKNNFITFPLTPFQIYYYSKNILKKNFFN